VNPADPRLPARRVASSEVMLPRLASSAAEAQACARLFGADRSTVLTGTAVSESELRRQAAAGYRYWHLTSHVVVDAERPNTSFIALSLPEKLTVLEVLGLPARAEMVTLNGCESGGGKRLPGTGVLGLTRAFLAAGAVSVLATHWQIPDESGALVQALYRNLQAPGSCRVSRSEALQQAQLAMLRAGGWRSEPRYWAAYFLSGWPGSEACGGSDRGGAL
jgi:CHAT domain-containing protein